MSQSYITCVVVPSAHIANVFGAVALALTDRVAETVAMPMSDAAALSALKHVLDTPSIHALAQVLGISHSGAVRLVDRLAAAGLVTRTSGPDGRTAAITLTTAGAHAATTVSAARTTVLAAALSVVRPEDHTILGRLLDDLLVALMRGPGATRWICRLCDTGACGRYTGDCPIGRALESQQLHGELEERHGHQGDQP